MSTVQTTMTAEQFRVLIPFMPGNCHLCNETFYQKLQILDSRKIPFAFLLSEDYEEDMDYIKKEYKLNRFNDRQFILSSALFERYHIFPQAYVLEYANDTSYKIYNNMDVLLEDLTLLSQRDTLDLGDYTIKKSSSDILVNNKAEMYVQSGVQTGTFDYIDLKQQHKVKVSFTPQQLFNIYRQYFKDSAVAAGKLNEANAAEIPKANEFVQFECVQDTLYATSMHTYILSMKDSVLRSFYAINIYKGGTYIGSRLINTERLPEDYYAIPKLHVYNNAVYITVVKLRLEADKPNYFLAKFDWKNGAYHFEKILPFTVPPIHNKVGYKFLELRFSGQYCMSSIANMLYNLETGQSTTLYIPVNDSFGYAHLMNNFKGVNIMVDHIDVQYPHLLITYYSIEGNGKGRNVVLHYNLENRNTEGKVQFPLGNSRFIHSDCSKFGYYFWLPEIDNNDHVVYEKLF